MKFLPASVAACLLAVPTLASDLTVDGVTDAVVPYGGAFQMTLTGNAALPAFLFADTSPGPTFFLGESVPLGLTPQAVVLVGGTTDGAGVFQTPYFLAEDPTHAGVVLYLAGVILDPTDPNGLDVSNGASLTIGPKVGAGDPQSTLIERGTVLDGSGATLADGTLAAGTTIAWQMLSTPFGSGASLVDADTLFPSFTPDIPGDYQMRVTATKSGVALSADTVVHAYSVALAPGLDGTYTPTGLANVLGTITGPNLANATLNGAALGLSPTGDFGPVTETAAAGDSFLPLLIEIENADGSKTRERYTLAVGAGVPFVFQATQALQARLNPSGYDVVETAAADLLADTDIETLLLAQGPVQIANDEGLFGFTIFSATVQFTSVTYGSISVDLTPTASGLSGVVNLHNVVANFDVWGEVLEIGYSLTGDMKTNPAVISANMGLSASGGTLNAAVQTISVNLQGFQFNLDGFLGDVAELFVIESSVKADVESAISDAVATEFPPAMEEILSAFVIAGNLFETLEVDVDLSVPIVGVVNSVDGTTIQLNGQASIGTPEPGSPPVYLYKTTPSAAPTFGATTPGGAPYGAGLAIADDFLNLVLAASTGAGLLNGDMTTLFEGTKGVGDLFQTDVLAVLFPDSGFELFPPGTPVGLRSYGTLPPIVTTTPGGASIGRIDMSDLEAVFTVEGPSGPIPVLRVAIDAGADLDLTIGTRGELVANLGESTLSASALQGMPGSSLTVLDQGIEFLESVLVPQLTKLFEGIPLPSLETQGIGLAPFEVDLVGGGSEYAGFYGDLLIVPTTP